GFVLLLITLLIFTFIAWFIGLIIIVFAVFIVRIRLGMLLGHSVRISENQFPEIYSSSIEVAERLNMEPPRLFLTQDPTLNAYALGFLSRKGVVLHSATVEAMEKKELQFIIGHEFTHIKCGHTTMLVLTSPIEGLSLPIISFLLRFYFHFWSRKAEYTCDRGGLLACRDLNSAVSSMAKLAVGPQLFKNLNIDSFLAQRAELSQDDYGKLGELLGDHPLLLKRIHRLREFFVSMEFQHLISI
ncbi:MAG: M48 family metallopeptidase, partial [Ignavibacteriae bacterium]|nr:M48 family metallopeptidase [Ignavibacteriota bacterium]